MTENKRYSFNWKNGHPNFWDNHCDLADCYLTCGDVVNILNELNDEVKSQSLVIKEYQNRNEALFEEIARQKFSKRMMRDNIQDYEKSIKNLRKSYEKFDEMRLRRIRFLEEKLKKNGLSIYVNDVGDVVF